MGSEWGANEIGRENRRKEKRKETYNWKFGETVWRRRRKGAKEIVKAPNGITSSREGYTSLTYFRAANYATTLKFPINEKSGTEHCSLREIHHVKNRNY